MNDYTTSTPADSDLIAVADFIWRTGRNIECDLCENATRKLGLVRGECQDALLCWPCGKGAVRTGTATWTVWPLWAGA